MIFCPKCGALLIPKKEGSKSIMACSKCSFKNKEKSEETIKETISKKGQFKMDVVEEETTSYTIVDEECPKCKNGQAAFWTIQTRAPDEPETKFYKCTKCKHTRRDSNSCYFFQT